MGVRMSRIDFGAFKENPPNFCGAKFLLPKIFGAFGAISFISYVFPYGPRKKPTKLFRVVFRKTHLIFVAQNLSAVKFVGFKNFPPPVA
jgi:hypothetical protein